MELPWWIRWRRPERRTSLRGFALGGLSGLLAGLFLAARKRNPEAERLRRRVEEERLARQRAERRAAEAEHLASSALDRERETADRLREVERKAGGVP